MKPLRAAALAMLLLPLIAPVFAAPQQGGYPNLNRFGMPADAGSPWHQHCLRVQHRQPPARDLARTPPRDGKACTATRLYYDKLHQAATSKAEWDQVRRCAMASNDTSVLMMLYANGFGVTQDTGLAIKYACSGEAAPAEMANRVMHLARLAEINRGNPFDQCDDVTSGQMGSYCASIAEEQAEKVLSAFLVRVRKGLTAPQQDSFDALLKASNAFAESHGNEETDMTGTSRVGMAINNEARQKEWLREHVAAFEKGQATLPAPEQFEAADALLNDVYRRVMEAPEPDPGHPGRLAWSTVEKPGVLATQRAWLGYRDAWVRFAAARYPAINPASLKTALTLWRTKQLAKLAP